MLGDGWMGGTVGGMVAVKSTVWRYLCLDDMLAVSISVSSAASVSGFRFDTGSDSRIF